MKKIIINSENRRFNISSIVVGYLDENKIERIEFEIPQEYQNFGKKACFNTNGVTFAKLFDDITSNILTITRNISQYNELDMSIEFFKTENEDEIIARTSILHIVIENAVICEDVKPDDEKVVILNELIEKVTNLEQDLLDKVENGDFNGKDALINGVNILEIVERDNIHLEQQANVLTISNTYSYDDNQIKDDIKKVNDNLNNYSLITETGSKIDLNINSSAYVMTLKLKDKNDNVISSGQVDLPLETMVIGATYNNETEEIELTLQNGTKVSFSVADLISGLVNEDDLTTKLNEYALKTSIPTKTSQLNNDSGFIIKSVNNLENYYKKTEIDTKVQTINTTTNGLNTRLTTAEKNIETNKTDIKDLSNRTKRIETDIFDSEEASGTGINLQDSTLAEFQEVKIDGVGNQVTTNGNQLIDFANPTNSSTGLTSVFENDTLKIVGHSGSIYQAIFWNIKELFTGNEGKKLKFKAKSSSATNQNTNSVVQAIINYNDGSSTYYRQLYNIANSSIVNILPIPEDISNIDRALLSIYTNNSDSTEIENTITIEEPLLYFDDNDTYEPYTGREPSPSPDYEQPIEVIEDDFDLVSCGKNLYYNTSDKYTFTSQLSGWHFINGERGASGINIGDKTLYKAKVKKGEKYKFKANVISEGVTNMTLLYGDENIIFSFPRIFSEYEFTSNQDGYFLCRLYVNQGYDVEVSNVELKLSSNQEGYEPYTETRQTITMPEGEFAGKIDNTYKDQFRINYNEQDGKYHLYLDKVVGKVVLNGSEIWSFLPKDNINRYYTNSVQDVIDKNNRIGLCNYFANNITSEYFINGTFTIAPSGALSFCYDSVMSLEQFKQWLSTHNTEVYYILAEPYTLDLGVVNMPLSYYPITNVYNTCVGIPNMYVKYYRDFKKTITTMQVDIENLKEAVSTLTSSQTSIDNDISTLKNVISSSLEEETESEEVTE